MKVALITFLLDPQIGGGSVASALRLARGLIRQGIKVVVISTHKEGPLRVSQQDGMTVYQFFPRNLYWAADKDEQPAIKKVLWQLRDTWNPHVYRQVRDILDREAPDIVHVHKLRGLSPAVWSAAAAVGSGPLVQTCRDYEVMSPEGTLTGRVGRWAEQGAWFLRPYQSFRAGVSEHVAVVTAPSRYTLDALVNRGFFRKAQKSVVPNTHGLTLPELEAIRDEAGPVASPLRLLYLGRLEAPKGVDILCRAFLMLTDRHPDAELHIAGWGPEEAELKARFGNCPQIVFHGGVFGSAKTALIAQSHALVIPSVWPEVFGNVIVEAYAYGKPVIGARAGGIPELIVEGETGYLVPPGDPPALADLLERLAVAPAALQAMAPACFDAARSFAVESVTEGYLQAYELSAGMTSPKTG